MPIRHASLLSALQADHAASLAILRSLTPAQWQLPVPSDEGAQWQARDVLAHLATAEAGHAHQITRLLQGEAPVPDDFDLNRYNRRAVQKQAERSAPELLAALEQAHAQLLAVLQPLTEADLDQTGRHARGDVLTVEQFFRRCLSHRRAHAEELQRALEK